MTARDDVTLLELALPRRQLHALDRLLGRVLDDDTAEFVGLARPADLDALVEVHRQVADVARVVAVDG